MNNKRGFFVVLCLLGLVQATTIGCVVNKAIPANAIADNLAVEKTQNEMLLLNVLRAKDDLPMVFTGITKITGSIKAEASLNAAIPLGAIRGDGSTTASPGAAYNWNPSFDVNVFDTTEFMTGFLTPIKLENIAYYWGLGFSPKILLNLMTLGVEVTKVSGCMGKEEDWESSGYILRNNHDLPDTDPAELWHFNAWVDQFVDQAGPYLMTENKPEPLGPTLDESAARQVLVKGGLKEGVSLRAIEKDGTFQLEREGTPKIVLKLKGGDETIKCIYRWTQARFEEWSEQRKLVEGFEKIYRKGDRVARCRPESGAGRLIVSSGTDHHDDMYYITFYLRSPESILYYLGELARIEEARGQTAHYCLGGTLQPLFVVRRSSDECGSKSVQATNAKGETYVIPAQAKAPPCCDGNKTYPHCGEGTGPTRWEAAGCDGGRSMEALTLVSQLIALQKSIKDLPTTSVVRVVGQ